MRKSKDDMELKKKDQSKGVNARIKMMRIPFLHMLEVECNLIDMKITNY
jgi:hypothetical protein